MVFKWKVSFIRKCIKSLHQIIRIASIEEKDSTYIFCFNQPFFRSIQDDLPKSLNTTTRDDTRLDEDRAYCKKDSCLMLLLGPGKKFLFLMARMIAIILISIFLVLPNRLLLYHNQTISTITFTGLVMGVVNQISTYFLDMKRLKWMILCLMLSVFECMLLTVLSSFLEEKLGKQ